MHPKFLVSVLAPAFSFRCTTSVFHADFVVQFCSDTIQIIGCPLLQKCTKVSPVFFFFFLKAIDAFLNCAIWCGFRTFVRLQNSCCVWGNIKNYGIQACIAYFAMILGWSGITSRIVWFFLRLQCAKVWTGPLWINQLLKVLTKRFNITLNNTTFIYVSPVH